MPTDVDLDALRQWVGCEYWPNPDGFQAEPVRGIDVARYTAALEDTRDWRGSTPPGFMEVASPNYLAYLNKSGEQFLRGLLPFESPWGSDWKPMMLIRQERWEIERNVVIGDVIRGRSTITDISWTPARKGRPEMLSVEFTKRYRDAGDGLLGCVVWDMVFVEHALAEDRHSPEESPLVEDSVALRAGRAPHPGDSLGRYTRRFDTEALVRWSAAIWDLGLPHIDPDYARQVYGLPHAVAHGPFINAALARLVTDWMDPADRIRQHRGRFRRTAVGNDRLTFTARVTEVKSGDTGTIAIVHAQAMNQHDELLAESETHCALDVNHGIGRA